MIDDAEEWLPIPSDGGQDLDAESHLRRRRRRQQRNNPQAKRVSFGEEGVQQDHQAHESPEGDDYDEDDEDDADMLRHSLQHIWPLVWFEEKTGVPRFYQAVVLVLATLGFTVYCLGILRCLNILAFAYPAFETLKALEYRQAKQEIFWLCYWCMYAVANLADVFLETAKLTWILPDNYWAFRAIFFLWCAIPQLKGGQIGFRHVLRPMFSANEDSIDQFLATLQRHCRQIMTEVRRGSSQLLTTVVVSTLTALHQGGVIRSQQPPPSPPSPPGSAAAAAADDRSAE